MGQERDADGKSGLYDNSDAGAPGLMRTAAVLIVVLLALIGLGLAVKTVYGRRMSSPSRGLDEGLSSPSRQRPMALRGASSPGNRSSASALMSSRTSSGVEVQLLGDLVEDDRQYGHEQQVPPVGVRIGAPAPAEVADGEESEQPWHDLHGRARVEWTECGGGQSRPGDREDDQT